MMNKLGINNLFVKKTPAAKRNKKVKMSAPAPARKSARLAKKDDDVFKHQTTIFDNNICLCISLIIYDYHYLLFCILF